MPNLLQIYTYGATRNNKNKSEAVGAWSYILKFGEHEKANSFLKPNNATANEMELIAILEAFKELKSFNRPAQLIINSDYIYKSIKFYLPKWVRVGYRKQDGGQIAYQYLYEEIYSYLQQFKNLTIIQVTKKDNSDLRLKTIQMVEDQFNKQS